MKNFDEFRKYMSENGDKISDYIHSKAESYADKDNVENIIAYDNAYTQIAIMKMLEEYHNWLNSKN